MSDEPFLAIFAFFNVQPRFTVVLPNHEMPRQECYLYALEAETGTQLWQYAATGTLFGTPVVGEEVMYIVLSSSVLALR